VTSERAGKGRKRVGDRPEILLDRLDEEGNEMCDDSAPGAKPVVMDLSESGMGIYEII